MLVSLIFVPIHGVSIAFLIASQWNCENLLGGKQQKFTEMSISPQCASFADFLPSANEVWSKVIFLLLSVIQFTGGSASVHAGLAEPPEKTPPKGDTPCAVYAGRYGQQVGGTHPTGMYTFS